MHMNYCELDELTILTNPVDQGPPPNEIKLSYTTKLSLCIHLCLEVHICSLLIWCEGVEIPSKTARTEMLLSL